MNLIKHPKMMDIAAKVIQQHDVPPDMVYIEVLWYNIHGNKHFGTKPWWIGTGSQVLKLTKEQFDEWAPYVVN